MKRFFILWISVIFFSPVFTQNLEQSYLLAREQMNLGNYNNAIYTFQRVLFFDQKGFFSFQAAYQTSLCYNKLDKQNKALDYMELAYHLTDDDSVKNEILFLKAWSYLKQKKYEHGLIELYNVNTHDSRYFTTKYKLYAGIIHFHKNEFDISKEFLLDIIGTEQKKDNLNLLFNRIEKIHRRYNPKTAITLSLIIPGLGQLYSGDIRNAANSLLLTGMFGYLFVHTALKYSFSDAFMSVMPWYQRYFMGGYQSAGKIAREKRKVKTKEIYQEIIQLME